MTAAATIPSWINKGQPRTSWPSWVEAAVRGRVDPNGSFIIETKLGQMRVHTGYMVYQWADEVRTCHAAEARQVIAELRAALEPVAPPPATNATKRSEADVADMRDDTDDITRRIRLGEQVDNEGPPPNTPSPLPTKSVVSRPPARAAAAPALKLKGAADPAKGSMPSIEWIQLARLQVDDAYQRSVDTGPSRALIQRIGKEWDWRLCVPLMVSRRGDGLFVIDGQHRLFGAKLRKDVPQLPCCISVYDSPADEAAMFVAANRERRAMNRLDDFHAAQAGNNPDALAVASLITAAGFTVSRKTGSAAWAPGEVAFTSAIEKVRRRHGATIAADALGLMADAFPGQRLVVGSSIFTSIVAILADRPNGYQRETLLKALRTFDMDGWSSFISQTRGGSTRAQQLKDMLLAAYADAAKAVA